MSDRAFCRGPRTDPYGASIVLRDIVASTRTPNSVKTTYILAWVIDEQCPCMRCPVRRSAYFGVPPCIGVFLSGRRIARASALASPAAAAGPMPIAPFFAVLGVSPPRRGTPLSDLADRTSLRASPACWAWPVAMPGVLGGTAAPGGLDWAPAPPANIPIRTNVYNLLFIIEFSVKFLLNAKSKAPCNSTESVWTVNSLGYVG